MLDLLSIGSLNLYLGMAAKKNINYSPTPLHHLMFILQQLSDELLAKEVGVSLSHVRIMGTLDPTVPRSQRVIASSLHQTEANISRQIRVMADDSLVKIAPNKKDHRQRDVTLTTKGVRKYTEAEKLLKKQEAQFLKAVNSRGEDSLENSLERLASSAS
jgi:DNA-binding MarR family transcriptional regulator